MTFDVVFIPALERGFLPSRRDEPYPGLVQQAARLLYVGRTRARLHVVLSMANYRFLQGQNVERQPTTFVGNLSGRFENRDTGFTESHVASIVEARTAYLSDVAAS
jgi:superfamily I DNA/RNA helicase